MTQAVHVIDLASSVRECEPLGPSSVKKPLGQREKGPMAGSRLIVRVLRPHHNVSDPPEGIRDGVYGGRCHGPRASRIPIEE